MISRSPYQVLGLEGDFEFKDIKKAYRKAILANPPEQNPEEFAIISNAYDSLTNEEYFVKDSDNRHYSLDIELAIEEEGKVDKSKYLKDIFEVPFII
ncbi:MAG: J domain-containing protein [Sulfurovum sp.]